jgi:YegS/Rv2252/BmrU family lipid kinase
VAVVNPQARNGGAMKRWPAIEAELRRAYPQLSVRMTEARDHATFITREALDAGVDLVVSVGGDGTNNEVLCGFVDEDGQMRHPGATLGIVAAGTGGDFQRQFGALSPARQAVRMAAAEPRQVDYGVARFVGLDGQPRVRPFLNVASVGLSGLVDRYIAQASRALGSTATYVMGSVRAIGAYRNIPVDLRVDGGDPRRIELTLLCVANGQYFGAGMWVAPDARIDDGKLDSILLTEFTKSRLLVALGKVFKAKHIGYPGVEAGQAERFELSPAGDEEVLIDIDGEQAGRLPASFEVVHRALRVKIA